MTQWGALLTAPASDDLGRQVLCCEPSIVPHAFSFAPPAFLGRMTDERTGVGRLSYLDHTISKWWKLDQGSGLWILGSLSGQRKGRKDTPASETLGPPHSNRDLSWGPMDLRARHGVSHAGHLWEAWQHNPPAFDPLITHHHHSELDSFLLPITIHKLGESAPRSTQASDLSGYRLIHRFPHPPP